MKTQLAVALESLRHGLSTALGAEELPGAAAQGQDARGGEGRG